MIPTWLSKPSTIAGRASAKVRGTRQFCARDTGILSVIMRIVSAVDAVVDFFGRIAAWTCVALVLLVAGNVLARYFFRVGTIWLQELEWHLLSPIALLGMSYALLRGDQVRVDLLYDAYSDRGRALVEVMIGVLLIIF